MPTISFQIPTEIKEILSKHPEIKWDKLVIDTLCNYAKKIQLMEKITQKSKLTNHDVQELDKTIKADLLKKYNIHN